MLSLISTNAMRGCLAHIFCIGTQGHYLCSFVPIHEIFFPNFANFQLAWSQFRMSTQSAASPRALQKMETLCLRTHLLMTTKVVVMLSARKMSSHPHRRFITLGLFQTLLETQVYSCIPALCMTTKFCFCNERQINVLSISIYNWTSNWKWYPKHLSSTFSSVVSRRQIGTPVDRPHPNRL